MEKIRYLFKFYYSGSDVYILVVDLEINNTVKKIIDNILKIQTKKQKVQTKFIKKKKQKKDDELDK